MGQRVRDRAVAWRPAAADRGDERVPRHARDRGPIQCRPADPEAKGLVERANGYLETSFLPGRRSPHRRTSTPSWAAWLVRANNRQHRHAGLPAGGPVGAGPGGDAARCRRSRRRSGGGYTHPAARAITTCGWTPTTTRCTRRWSAAGSTSAPTWSRLRCVCDGRLVARHDRVLGRAPERSPTRPTRRPPRAARTRIGRAAECGRSTTEVARPRPGRLRPHVRPATRQVA